MPRHKWEHTIRMDLMEIVWAFVKLILLAQDRTSGGLLWRSWWIMVSI